MEFVQTLEDHISKQANRLRVDENEYVDLNTTLDAIDRDIKYFVSRYSKLLQSIGFTDKNTRVRSEMSFGCITDICEKLYKDSGRKLERQIFEHYCRLIPMKFDITTAQETVEKYLKWANMGLRNLEIFDKGAERGSISSSIALGGLDDSEPRFGLTKLEEVTLEFRKAGLIMSEIRMSMKRKGDLIKSRKEIITKGKEVLVAINNKEEVNKEVINE